MSNPCCCLGIAAYVHQAAGVFVKLKTNKERVLHVPIYNNENIRQLM